MHFPFAVVALLVGDQVLHVLEAALPFAGEKNVEGEVEVSI